MVYEPSKKEKKQIEDINDAYKLIRKGLNIILDNVSKNDLEIDKEIYKMSKSFDKIIKRVYKILENKYIDKEFINIISFKDIKIKSNRFKNKNRKKTNFVQVRNPKTGHYVKIDKNKGEIISQKISKGPYKNIRIIKKTSKRRKR